MEALLYFVVWAAIIFFMLRYGCGSHVLGHGHGAAKGGAGRAGSGRLRWVPPESDTDPVCGKTVRTDRAKPSVHDGMVYYFCSRECRDRFEAAPELYVGQTPGAAPPELEDHVHG